MKKVNGFRIRAKQTPEGWVEGAIGKMNFQAVVYSEGSPYGINEGRVSKLFIWDEQVRQRTGDFCGACAVVYERNWDLLPTTESDMAMTDALVEYLEALPTAEFWEEIAQGEPFCTKLEVKPGYPTNVRIKIDHTGWAQVQDCLTSRFYKRIDPITVLGLLEQRK